MRSLTNIPYSKESHDILLEKVKGTQVEIELREAIEFDLLRITPLVECRSKLSDKLMKGNGATKVLELASGLSPRGFKWTENPQITYVEFDLPHKIKEKRQIVSQLKMNSHPNLYFEAGDVLHREDMITATSHFQTSDGPIVIVNEGLLGEVLLEMISKVELENEVGSRISFVMRCKSTV
ncbi:unnamed protein product [Sphagnum tenellum]